MKILVVAVVVIKAQDAQPALNPTLSTALESAQEEELQGEVSDLKDKLKATNEEKKEVIKKYQNKIQTLDSMPYAEC